MAGAMLKAFKGFGVFFRLFHAHRGWMLLGSLFGLATLICGIGLLALSGWFISACASAGLTAATAHLINFFFPSIGVRLFAVDCEAEVEKIARSAPGSRVFCRILCDNEGADWPLSRKFGCDADMAIEVLEQSQRLGLVAHGISFHVGSQQKNPEAWNDALATSGRIFRTLAERGINLKMVNLGGGFPAHRLQQVPERAAYGLAIFQALRRHFGNRIPETIIEPGRGMVADAGIIKSEVLLISRKSANDEMRWVYLDIGKFGGLIETMDEAIRYRISTKRDGEETAPVVLAGPTCDSVDVLYEREPFHLPVSLEIGDEVLIEAAGAYTASYSSVSFNGFPPLRSFVI
jgi:ornithine decarboxylase